MSTIIIRHDDCFRHNPGPRHPESMRRIQAVMDGLEDLANLLHLPAPRATLEQITRVHPSGFWEQIMSLEPPEGIATIDADTYLSNGSVDATLRGSGGLCFAVEQLLAGKARRAFCAVRPPGHHSEPGQAMGFCLLNHVAIGARHALQHPGVERVAIIDFDVHHGNGTQAVFEQDPDVLFVSSHQSPLYPGTGGADETGCGNIINMPLSAGDGGHAFRSAWKLRGLPAVHDFNPDLILVSAGFDAHRRDPLAQLELHDEDFRWITEAIADVAESCCQGRIASILEGGYDLKALASASREHVKALSG
jgi:acetoin utilization deacetylase AcuC-like enzyme